MANKAHLSTDDINHPDHRAEPAELFMGFIGVLTALSAAVALSEFFPGKRK
jgi:hypothetical protein